MVVEVSSTETRAPARKTLAWTVLVLVVALWVFVVFFFDGILSNIAREKLIEYVNASSHGEYQLAFNRFDYSRGVLFASRVDLDRIAYRRNERGTTLRQFTIDSVRITGVSPWDVLFGRPIVFSGLRTYAPKLYLCDAAEEAARTGRILPDTIKSSKSSGYAPIISVKNVLIPGVQIFGREGSADKQAGTISLSGQQISYDAKSPALLHINAKDLYLQIPWIHYADSGMHLFVDSAYAISADSILTIGSFEYAAGTTKLGASGLITDGLNLSQSRGHHIAMRGLDAQTWVADFVTKSSKQPSRPGLFWQDKLAGSAAISVKIGNLMLHRGVLDVHLAPNGIVSARGLTFTAPDFDFDSGAPASQPLFSPHAFVSAASASYTDKGMQIVATNDDIVPWDSLVTIGSVVYHPTAVMGGRKSSAPIEFDRVTADGIRVSELMAWKEVSMQDLHASAWRVNGLPASTRSKSTKKQSTASASIWAQQREIAKSVGIPIHIASLRLGDGELRVAGRASPTIRGDRVDIDAEDLNIDSTAATKALFFSKDIGVSAATFDYADARHLQQVNLRSARSRLSRRSISAGSATYLTRSTFEPAINTTSIHCDGLDMAGIDFGGLLDNKRIALSRISTASWKIERTMDTTSPPSANADGQTAPANVNASKSGWKIPITIGNAHLPNGAVLFRERDTVPGGWSPTFTSKVTRLDVSKFRFLPPYKKRPRLGFDQVVCAAPVISYAALDGFYSFEVRNLLGNLRNSILTMDSLSYSPRYSEDEYAALHQYARGRTDFRLAPVRLTGIDTKRLISGEGILVDRIEVPTLWLDYYKDKRKPSDPNPKPARMPNQLVRLAQFPVTVDKLDIENGKILIREHTRNGAPPGDLTFHDVKLSAAPITLDSASPIVNKPTRFDASGVFIGQAPVQVTVIYPLHDSTLNLTADGVVGPFDLKQLNSYLVNAARYEVTSGQFHHGDVKIQINGGTASTMVLPIYDHFKLKVLPPDPNDAPDIEEGVKTFVANTFILRDDNPDENGGPPKVGNTMLQREAKNEFFQFLWFAMRKSLGQVVGGLK